MSCVLHCLKISHIFLKVLNLPSKIKMSFYGVASGRATGIFLTWPECESQVKGFKGAKYKKFNSRAEASQFVYGVSAVRNSNPRTPSSASTSSSNSNSSIPSSNLLTSASAVSSSSNQRRNFSTTKKREIRCGGKSSSKNDDKFEDISDIHEELMRKMEQIEKDVGEIGKNVLKKTQNSKKTIMIDPLPKETPSLKRPAEPIVHLDSKRLKTLDITQGSRTYKFDIDDSGYVEVYTDGACSSNGRKVAKAGLGVYFGENHPLNASEPVSGRATNNCGEIQAATKAIRLAHRMGVKKLNIKTDSQFVINSVTKWMSGWKKKGWKLASGEPVKNEIDFKDLDEAIKLMNVKWEYVKAHKGIFGNERADQLAKEGATRYIQK